MIYTLSLNPAIDMTITTDTISRDRINKTDLRSISAGGKGFNTSRALNCLNMKNTAIAFCGGFFSSNIKKMLEKEKIRSKLIPIKESIRVNIKMVERKSYKVVEFNETGPDIYKNEMNALLTFLRETGSVDDYFVISGSLPNNVDERIYKEVISILKKNKVKILLDASGKPLYHGVEAIPDIIKVNREEISGLCMEHGTGQDDLARILIKRGIKMIMVTDGPRDTFYYDISGKYRIKSPDTKGPYKTGAGDSVNAGLIYAIQNDFSIEERLRFAVACGNANILNETPGSLDLKTVENLAAKAEVIRKYSNQWVL